MKAVALHLLHQSVFKVFNEICEILNMQYFLNQTLKCAIFLYRTLASAI